MKKIIGIILTLSLAATLVFSLSACKKNQTGLVEHSELGLNFMLPNEFRKFTVQTADIHYSTPEAKFEVQYMPKTDFEDIEMGYYISFDMTVKEYTEFLIEENGWADPEKTEQYTYDEARDATNFSFFWSPDRNLFPYEYYYFTVMKNEYAFYVAMFSCEQDLYPNYNEKFEEWSRHLSLYKAQ